MGWCLRRRLQTLAWQIETNNLCFIATFDSGHSEDPAAKTLDGAAGGSLGGSRQPGLKWGSPGGSQPPTMWAATQRARRASRGCEEHWVPWEALRAALHPGSVA